MAFPLNTDAPDIGIWADNFERARSGLKTEVLYVPLSEVKINFGDVQGRSRELGHAREKAESRVGFRSPHCEGIGQDESLTFIRANQFRIDYPNIDPMLVKSCEIRLDYENDWVALARIEVYVLKEPEGSEDDS